MPEPNEDELTEEAIGSFLGIREGIIASEGSDLENPGGIRI